MILIDSQFRLQCGLKKHLDIKHIYSVSLYAKHVIADEYREQKSAGYIKTGLAVCVQNRAARFWIH